MSTTPEKRVIKFRAWDKREKKMLPWDEISAMPMITVLGNGNRDLWEPLEFTGLHDKHGVEIYEGDIVKHDLWGEFMVEWDAISAGFRATGDDDDRDINMGHVQLPRIRVIGNIYENPHLLP